MEQLLWIRENIISFCKKFETVIWFVVKLIAAMYVFELVNDIGLWRDEFTPLFTAPLDFPLQMLLALLFTILPPTAANLLLILAILVQFSLSLEVAFYVFVLLVLILAFYGRISPKKSLLIVAIVIAYRFNLPYAVALFAGLYLGVTSAIPIIIGTGVSAFAPFFLNLADTMRTPETLDLIELPITFMELYKTIFEHMSTNLDWVVWAFVLAMAVLAVYAISRLSFPFAKDIAVASGGLLTIIGFAIAKSVAGIDISMGSVVGGVLLSILLVEFVRFFDSILDYRRVERVQFEDEDNYYYVKVVPKIVGEHPGEALTRPAPARAPRTDRTPARLTDEDDAPGEPPRTARPALGSLRADAPRPAASPRVSGETQRATRPAADDPRETILRGTAARAAKADADARAKAIPEDAEDLSKTRIRPHSADLRDDATPVRKPAPAPDPEIADMVFDDENE